jgi:NAD(P)-dependent dehydrogenase (short-subunit alcohol dehydrogenase family)
MRNIEGKTALVTGAGSGIGRATALALADAGLRVAVSDIDAESAGDTAETIRSGGQEAQAFTLDVSIPEQLEEVADRIKQSMGSPSILVNNAGIAVGGYFLDCSEESWHRIISINLMGVIHCCRVFVPLMVDSGQPGHVVNISSMLGYTGARGASAYCATKFGVLGFSESLRAEMAEHDVGVSTICPGMVRTNIINNGILESQEYDVEEKRAAIDALYERRNYSPDRVAKAIIGSIRRNRAVAPVTPEAWLAYYLKRWAPWLVGWFARRDLVEGITPK